MPIHLEGTARCQNESLVERAFEITHYSLDHIFMGLFWRMSVSHTLMHCKGYVRTTLTKIQEHTNYAGIIDAAASLFPVNIFP